MNVFTYWEGNKPAYITLCHKTLAVNNPGFKIYTPEDIEQMECMKEYVNDPYYKALMPAHRADIIRIKVLEQFGGVWIDSDFIAMNSFSNLIESATRQHALYYYRDSWQATNGILIAPPQHSMIIEWSRKIDCVYSNLKRLNRIPNPENEWCSFGADQLKVCIDNAIENHKDLGWDRVQLISYFDMHRYFVEDEPNNLRHQAWPGCYGYMLFNTGFPQWFKEKTEEEIMNGRWLITLLFKLGMKLEKF